MFIFNQYRELIVEFDNAVLTLYHNPVKSIFIINFINILIYFVKTSHILYLFSLPVLQDERKEFYIGIEN